MANTKYMDNTPKYIMYRNRRIPGWWQDYLPDEKNPYKKEDTLTIEKGCLKDFWYIHSSNKHRNPRGVDACNAVQRMVYERFGGAFLSSPYGVGYSRPNGPDVYNEPEYLLYENAYLDDYNIHIKNARQYYEDVISFMLKVLQMISSNHMQSGMGSAYDFFPGMTDSEVKKKELEMQARAEKKKAFREDRLRFINGPEFRIDEIEFSDVDFSAYCDWEDGWISRAFSFSDIRTNIGKEVGTIEIRMWVPHLPERNHDKKDPAKATKTLELQYCLYFCSSVDGQQNSVYSIDKVYIPVPPEKVSVKVKESIQEACEKAMQNYIDSHMEYEHTNYTPSYQSYPSNFFLDNGIGKLKLEYAYEA